jgi:hypothetical protein
MKHELLRLFDVGMRRRQRRLKHPQRFASKRESSMQITELEIANTYIQT